MRRVRFVSSIFLLMCILSSPVLAKDNHLGILAECSIANNTIGIIFDGDKFEYSAGVSTSYPNLAFMLMKEDNWEFKYYSTSENDMFLHALFYYNALDFNALYKVINYSRFKLNAGSELSFGYVNANRLGLESKYYELALRLTGKLEICIFDNFSIYGKASVPLADVIFTKNNNPYIELVNIDNSLLSYAKYNATLGVSYKFGG